MPSQTQDYVDGKVDLVPVTAADHYLARLLRAARLYEGVEGMWAQTGEPHGVTLEQYAAIFMPDCGRLTEAGWQRLERAINLGIQTVVAEERAARTPAKAAAGRKKGK